MSFKFKTLIGLYVFSILLISGASKAEANEFYFNKPSTDIGIKISQGKVFELNGNLYFESKDKEALLVHSSNFSFFEDADLPIYIEAQSIISIQDNGTSSTFRTIRFVADSIQRSGLF